MISHFIHCPQANQHPHIVIYRDNEDPYLFYYINSHPRIKIDDATKKPAFDYTIIGRKSKNDDDQETQQGRLVMSVNLALTDKEMKDVEAVLNSYVRDRKFTEDLKIFYENYASKGVSNSKSIKIRPVEFNSGNVSINLASSGFSGNYIHETKPTLFGDCNATIASNLGAQESNILYEILRPKEKKDKNVNLSAVVNYELKYNTFVPFTVKATIHYKRIYDGFQNLVKTHSGMDSKYYGRYTLPATGRTYYSNGADLYVSKEDLLNYLKNSDSTNQNIKIDIQNFSNTAENDKYEELVLNALSSHLNGMICDKLFEKADPISVQQDEVSNYDVKTTGSKGSEASEKKRNVLFDVSYKLKTDITTTVTNDFEMTINKGKVIEAEANPNNSLELMLDGKYSLESLVKEIDASDIYFQPILVPIKVDNTNFGRDIAVVSVRVIYKDRNNKEKLNQVFNFDEENPDTKTFKVLMDRDNDRKLIDKFYYQTRIRYRGFDVHYGKKDENDKWTELKEAQGIGEGIYVPYSDMGNLCVNCKAGDIAWDDIEKVDVELKYKDDPDQKGATKIITLTAGNPSDTWNCYMYKGTSNYLYRIHYFYKDGTEDWSEEFESSSEELCINDKLSGVFRAKFELNFRKSVERARVIIKCQGKEEDSGWIYQPDTWTWESRIKEDGNKSFLYKYQYYLVNGDDSMHSSDWSDPQSMEGTNQQTIPIDINLNEITLIIDGESIDWNKWSRVYLHFKYDDDANNLHYDDEKIQPLKLSSNKCEATVVIPVIDDTIRPRISAEYIPQLGEDVVLSEEKTASKIVILPNAAPPKEDNTVSAPIPTSSASVEPTIEKKTEEKPTLVKNELSLTFNVKSMDWDKWMRLYIHIKYDDEENNIHIDDNNQPMIKMKSGSDDQIVTIQIKNPEIKPLITIDYMSQTGDLITTDPTPVSGPLVILPDAVPPKT